MSSSLAGEATIEDDIEDIKKNSKSSSSPFEQLNTLKLLFNCGHINSQEYQVRFIPIYQY